MRFQPFLTPEQLATFNEDIGSIDLEVSSIGTITTGADGKARGTSGEALGAQSLHDAEATNTDLRARKQTGNSMDEMVRRGLFQSSIKDSEMFDIEATKNIRKNFLNTNLGISLSGMQNRQAGLGIKRTGVVGRRAAQEVANAEELERNTPYPEPPAAAPAPEEAAPAPAARTIYSAPATSAPRPKRRTKASGSTFGDNWW